MDDTATSGAAAVAVGVALLHVPRRLAEAQEHPVEVGRGHLSPVREAGVDERCEPAESGVGDHHVDGPVLGDGGGERPLDVALVGDVAPASADRRTVAGHRAQPFDRGGGLLLVAAPDVDAGAGVEERLGQTESDTAVAAGHDRDAPPEIAHRRKGIAIRFRSPEPGRAGWCRTDWGKRYE